MTQLNHLIIVTDLDGCLLNKHDYAWQDARESLLRLVELKVPLVFASSKTLAEIDRIAAEVPCLPAPYIAENGGAIRWGPLQGENDAEIQHAGIPRPQVLQILLDLKSQFQFRSFRDLELPGVMQATGLRKQEAILAMDRHSTEPLLWDDSTEQRNRFEQILGQHGLTLTKGGRFWHVAGQTSKGQAVQQVRQKYNAEKLTVVAIGDSQIDQSMLDVADIPVGIRAGGKLNVNVRCPPGIVPKSEGAQGWSEAVAEILDKFD